MPKPPRNPGVNPSRQHRLYRDRGRRWELTMLKKFEREGFSVERTDERDGLTKGIDLLLWDTDGHPPRKYLPVAIQCKHTAELRDVLVGLREAKSGFPAAKIWICCHREYLGPGFKGRDTFGISLATQPDSIYTDLSFSGMIALLKKVLSGLDPLH